VQFTIPSEHPSLPGHFPGNPVVPGVVVLDRVLDAVEAEAGLPVGALRLPQVKFMQPLLPGQPATVSVDGVSTKWRFRVHHGERLIASGEVVLVAEVA
jgi:3-hydroxymyristoyl/3-hydroxydecanoyl-(acyl carrier protein) dehydratase